MTVTEDEAYKKAKYIDNSMLKADFFESHSLFGAVVAYKDLFLTKGVRTTAGSRVLSSYVPAYSGTVVKKMEEAGAIMIERQTAMHGHTEQAEKILIMVLRKTLGIKNMFQEGLRAVLRWRFLPECPSFQLEPIQEAP